MFSWDHILFQSQRYLLSTKKDVHSNYTPLTCVVRTLTPFGTRPSSVRAPHSLRSGVSLRRSTYNTKVFYILEFFAKENLSNWRSLYFLGLYSITCPRRESNPHTFRHTPLKRACLPIPPPGRKKEHIDIICNF